MDKEVFVTLKGLQINEPIDAGAVEVVALGEFYEPLMYVKSINRQNAIQARLPFYVNIK